MRQPLSKALDTECFGASNTKLLDNVRPVAWPAHGGGTYDVVFVGGGGGLYISLS